MAVAYIYALIDPTTNDVRYIGKADDVMSRFASHCHSIRTRNTPVYQWMRELQKAGLKPLVASLERVDASEWEDAERRVIAEYRNAGTLLNVADGGNQPYIVEMHADPFKKRIWSIKKEFGHLLRNGLVSEVAKAKVRAAAKNRPDLFGKWANI